MRQPRFQATGNHSMLALEGQKSKDKTPESSGLVQLCSWSQSEPALENWNHRRAAAITRNIIQDREKKGRNALNIFLHPTSPNLTNPTNNNTVD